MMVEPAGVLCSSEKLWWCGEQQCHENLQCICTSTKVVGYTQVTSASFWSSLHLGLTASCFQNPVLASQTPEMRLSFPIAFIFGFALVCAVHNLPLGPRGLTLTLGVGCLLMHHDPEEPETQKCNQGKLPKNWISTLLKQVQGWLRNLVTVVSFSPRTVTSRVKLGQA